MVHAPFRTNIHNGSSRWTIECMCAPLKTKPKYMHPLYGWRTQTHLATPAINARSADWHSLELPVCMLHFWSQFSGRRTPLLKQTPLFGQMRSCKCAPMPLFQTLPGLLQTSRSLIRIKSDFLLARRQRNFVLTLALPRKLCVPVFCHLIPSSLNRCHKHQTSSKVIFVVLFISWVRKMTTLVL